MKCCAHTLQVQAMASVPSIVNRLRMHLLMPGQAYDSLTAGMHLLTHLVESLSSNRGTDAVYCVLHVLYQAPLAKLMAATSGVKSGPLAEQVVSLMDKLLLHANQVRPRMSVPSCSQQPLHCLRISAISHAVAFHPAACIYSMHTINGTLT